MLRVGIRTLKNDLSRYVRRAEAGEHVLVTDRGRVVAQLIPAAEAGSIHASRYDALVAAGVIRPAPGPGGDPLRDLPSLRLPRGTASRWIDEVRGER